MRVSSEIRQSEREEKDQFVGYRARDAQKQPYPLSGILQRLALLGSSV